jgi:hypothetical protein
MYFQIPNTAVIGPETVVLPKVKLASDNKQPAADGVLFAVEQSSQNSQDTVIDYSEEAIPERDPNYRPVSDALYDSPTTEVLSAEERRELARCLEQLGMNAVRAAVIASL